MKTLASYHYLPNGWDFLHFVAFQLPNVDPFSIDLVTENQISFSFDKYGKTPLDYMLAYEGARKMQVQLFFTYFFKNISSFVNLKVLDPEKVLLALTSQLEKIFESQTESSNEA